MGIFSWLFGDSKYEPISLETGMNKSMVSAINAVAELGSPRDQYNYGIRCMNGEEVLNDEAAGFEWLKKSAHQHFLSAEVALGRCFSTGTSYCNQDYSEAIEWYFKAASHPASELDAHGRCEIIEAICGLGFIYAKGKGLPKRTGEVIELLSANTEGVSQPYCLGYIFASGCYGQSANVEKAVAWFGLMIANDLRNSEELSAGFIDGRFECGYVDNERNPLDFKKVIEFIIEVSNMGIAEAHYVMAVVYWHGWRGVQQDKRRAVQLLEYAAAQGHVAAQDRLAQIR